MTQCFSSLSLLFGRDEHLSITFLSSCFSPTYICSVCTQGGQYCIWNHFLARQFVPYGISSGLSTIKLALNANEFQQDAEGSNDDGWY